MLKMMRLRIMMMRIPIVKQNEYKELNSSEEDNIKKQKADIQKEIKFIKNTKR